MKPPDRIYLPACATWHIERVENNDLVYILETERVKRAVSAHDALSVACRSTVTRLEYLNHHEMIVTSESRLLDQLRTALDEAEGEGMKNGNVAQIFKKAASCG